uniref:Pre-mRNA-splicing factor SPF27 n=1 Tax=Heterorhabditis bacteriophora TaxID=37862 RepID=A0A1I7XTS6_HETBA
MESNRLWYLIKLVRPLMHHYHVKKSKRIGGNGWNLDAFNDLSKRVYNVQALLRNLGIRCLVGGADGEAQCAQLEQASITDGCITTDFDYFLFDLTRSRLVVLALLLGCDYFEGGVGRVGMVTALEIISEFSLHEDDHALSILDRFSETVSVYLNPKVTLFANSDLPKKSPTNMKVVEQILEKECGWKPERFSQELGRSQRRARNIRKSSHQPKLTGFFTPRRRSAPVVAECSKEESRHYSRREWAALEKLRSKAMLYAVDAVSYKRTILNFHISRRILCRGIFSFMDLELMLIQMSVLALTGPRLSSAPNQDEQVMEIHAHRKLAQMDAGRQLKELEGNWVSMVTNNYRSVFQLFHS